MEWTITYPGGDPSYGRYDPVSKYGFEVFRSGGNVYVRFENKGEKGLKSGLMIMPAEVAVRLGPALSTAGAGEARVSFSHEE